MADLIMLMLIVACFALAQAYARLCDHLLAPTTDENAPQ
jgi:hypothetical protein